MRGQGAHMGNRRAGDPKKRGRGPVEGAGEGGRVGLPSPSPRQEAFLKSVFHKPYSENTKKRNSAQYRAGTLPAWMFS
jgi:hypothetical protein